MEYFVDSYDMHTLGSRVIYKGAQWYISSLKRELKEGLLVCTYELRQKAAMFAVKQYNGRITGISVDGQTTEIKRDKVRVSINGDMTHEQGTYWFPFSTVAASSDGSGWYSMPEQGDSVRVYFPTWDEKEAYVITKHDSHMPASPGSSSGGASPAPSGGGSSGSGSTVSGGGGGYSSGGGGNSGGFSDGGGGGSAAAPALSAAAASEDALGEKEENPMDDPSKRNIFTKDGNVVQMTSAGVLLKAGQSRICMFMSGRIFLNAPSGITIIAGEQLYVSAKNVVLEAGNVIEMKDDAGASVTILKKQIHIKAEEIYEN